ncbi:hypothetical protein KXD40_003321 [Peronospora effusa]|uniref:Uncharacterized protein n=1 Tax=Peronospora effusa TaxID=542832 RepID=A0A3M6V9K7_9STRA|nr:hypothetical protein DD238_007200 [Peronospora effusa]RQM11740.1 hypothetical protein DD237_007378 [Peronospora effusa]UIZ29920.1 hypothetical protein KXD40_003321 [Peronospora effusa]
MIIGPFSIHGYHVDATNAVSAGEAAYEHAGAMVALNEAKQLDLISEKTEMSFKFDVNGDAVLDSKKASLSITKETRHIAQRRQ